MNRQRADFGILGFGLAGAVLAWELRRCGASVVWADEDHAGAASPIAPGLVNPLAGRKLKPDARFGAWHARLMACVPEWEAYFGQTFWHPTPLIRFVESAAQAKRLDAVCVDSETARWVGARHEPGAHGELFQDAEGSFTTAGAGWFEIPAFVAAMRGHPEIRQTTPDALAGEAAELIDCRGWRCAGDARWRDLPWNCARGELLEVALEVPLPPVIWNGGVWLRPIAGDRWLCGATYGWEADAFADPPTAEAGEQLQARLGRWFRPKVRPVRGFAGVRPVLIDYRPVLGRSDEAARWSIFSGLGSKGALLAPFYGAALARHLTAGEALPEEVDLRRFRATRREE